VTSIIVAHNHPSGNLNPSKSDIDLTKRLREAGNIIQIKVLDHVIITNNGYFSFEDEGI
jgi:DNA repair protein RadC